MWLPFNIFHPRPAQSSSSHQFTTNPYTGREAGAAEVNVLPEWTQASLRLMHTKQKNGLPSDPIWPKTNKTVEDWDAAIAQLEIEAADAQTRKQNAIQALDAEHRAYQQVRSAIQQAQIAKDVLQAEMERRQDLNAETMKLEFEASHLPEQIKQRQKDSFFCNYLSMFCESAAERELLRTTAIEKHRAQIDLEISRIEIEIKKRQDQSSTAETVLEKAKISYQQFVKENSFNREKIESELSSAQSILMGMQERQKSLNGFYVLESRGQILKWIDGESPCVRPLEYKFKTVPQTNPLFEDSVEPSLHLRSDSRLIVCVNDAIQRLGSVHIFRNNEEQYRTQIQRDDSGKIIELSLREQTGLLLEEHGWLNVNGTDRSRYTFRFKLSGKEYLSIYTDIEN